MKPAPKKTPAKAPTAPRKPRKLIPAVPVPRIRKKAAVPEEPKYLEPYFAEKPPVPAEPVTDIGHHRVSGRPIHPWLRAIKAWFWT